VLVIGLRLPRASVRRTALPPAEAVGPYAFAQYESANLLRLLAVRAMARLSERGHRAALTFDLCGTGSLVGNPRGEQPDAFANRFAAVAAGLGHLSRAGFVVNGELGPLVRFAAVVTDAVLAPDELAPPVAMACDGCRRCLEACATEAFGAETEVQVGGAVERFAPIERTRCDWAKRYSLNGQEGVNYLGWDLNLPAPPVITPEALAEGLRQQPSIPKYRPCNFEACLLACPMVRG
jgi:ferredoxin